MKPGSIIPSNVASLKSLTVTMAVMSYLACLAIGALILVDRAVTSWTSGLAREMTVQVRQIKSADIDAEVEKVRSILDGFPGILAVEVLGPEAGAKCWNHGWVYGHLRACRCRVSFALSWMKQHHPT